MIVRVSRTGPVDATFQAPPSKSYTHRALIAGALASGRTRIEGPLRAADTELTARGLETLGVSLEWLPGEIAVAGCNGTFPAAGEVDHRLRELRDDAPAPHLGGTPCPAPGGADRESADARAAGRPARRSAPHARRGGRVHRRARLPGPSASPADSAAGRQQSTGASAASSYRPS